MPQSPVQTTFTDNLSGPFAGVIADAAYAHETVAAFNTEVSASIPFGWGVARDNTAPYGATGNGAKLPAATTDKLLGITQHSHTYSLNPLNLEIDTVGMKPGVLMNVMRHGRIWAQCENGCVPGNSMFVRCTATGNGKGALLSSDPGGSAVVVPTAGATVKVGEWQTTAAANGLAILEVMMVNA